MRILLHRLSLDFRSFSSFSNSVFSLAFMEGLLHLLSVIFHSAFTNSYRNNATIQLHSRTTCSGENRCGIHSLEECLQSWWHGQNLRYLKLPFSALRRSFSGLSYIEVVYFSFLTCMLQFKSFYHSIFCNVLKFLMTDRQTDRRTNHSTPLAHARME